MASTDLDVLIVGGGFGGCYLLKLLRDQGLKVQVFEAGPTLGGVWCWSRYPGARVDCELPYYGYSDPAVWKTYIWPERFPDHFELRRYFQHVAKVWDLHRDISCNTQVVGATWRDDHWEVETADGKKCTARWFLPATGTSFRTYIPDWKGKDSFKGTLCHSGQWPEGLDMTGKRVAVIGSGSTGLQVMQEAGKVASHVTHYIRSPSICIPLRQRKISPEEVVHHRNEYPHVFRACRTTRTGLAVEGFGRATFDDSAEKREAGFEEQWQRGGFNWVSGCYNDYGISPEANREMYNFWLKKTRPRIQDPKKRDILAPMEPPYYLASKRPSLEADYFEQCDQPHVDVTKSPIQHLTETGIVNEDGAKDFDIIAVCTGYDAVTGGLKTMGIRGRNGLELQEKWDDGIYTHLGMMVHGFPNMYIVYGPQAPTSFTNGPPFIEMQCEWIADTIAKQRKENYVVAEAKKSEEEAWRKHTLEIAGMTLAIHTNSWYMGTNIPGKKREMMLYMGGIPLWHQQAVEALDNWKGFDVYSPKAEGSHRL